MSLRARLALAVALVAAASATAAADRIVLTDEDAELRRALEASLDAAGIAVQVVASPAPTTPEDALDASRALSAREGASAVIWIVADAGGASTILVFDREMDRVLVRPLAHAPPLRAEEAAEAASMVRTMLRAIRVTPDVDVAPPRTEDAAAIRAEAADITAPRPAPRRRFAVEVGSIAAFGDPRTAAWGVAGSFAWYPRRFGVALAIAGGPSGAVDAASLDGRYGDLEAAVVARVPVVVAGRTSVELAAGLALHRTSLEGELMTSGTTVDQAHWDPAVRVDASAIYRIARSFGVVLTASADGFLRRQRYLDGADAVTETPGVRPAIGLHLRVLVP